MGALFTFNPAPQKKATSILVRVGVSLISSAQACENAEEEIPDFDFDGVHAASRAQWNDLLGRIQVDTTGDIGMDTATLFYSSVSPLSDTKHVSSYMHDFKLYRTHISPADCKLKLH